MKLSHEFRQRLARRGFLAQSATTLGTAALASLFTRDGLAVGSALRTATGLNAARPHFAPLAKRVVSREGLIKSSVSVQAPSHYVLRGLDNNKTINYLYSPSTNILVENYWGKKVFVTGEEVLDERWPNTPVIEIETIDVIPAEK